MTAVPMSPGRLAEITEALRAVPPPPWQWRGDTFNGPYLCTATSGWASVLHFRRLGMRGAQPVFPVVDERGWTRLADARELMVPRTEYDTKTFRDVDNPVARWMRDAPLFVAELLAERNRLARALADKTDEKSALQERFDEFRETCASHSADRNAEQVAAEDVELKVKTAREAVDAALLQVELGLLQSTDPGMGRLLSCLKAILA